MKNAIVICSGGLDSVTTAYYVKKKLNYDKIRIIFFDYGQKGVEMERECSRKCAGKIGADQIEMNLFFLGELSKSLINKEGKVNKLGEADLKDTKEESKVWYVPNRNSLFINHAVALAESLGGADIFLGFKNEGREDYSDTTPEFVKKMNELVKIACSNEIKVIAPFIEKDKEDIIHVAKQLGVRLGDTFSCYIGKEKHCGYCLACKLRQQGFKWAGIDDPTEYGE
jgi:7-cyano-7-deazaguanine synthase